jgi:hypothetical protein
LREAEDNRRNWRAAAEAVATPRLLVGILLTASRRLLDAIILFAEHEQAARDPENSSRSIPGTVHVNEGRAESAPA